MSSPNDKNSGAYPPNVGGFGGYAQFSASGSDSISGDSAAERGAGDSAEGGADRPDFQGPAYEQQPDYSTGSGAFPAGGYPQSAPGGNAAGQGGFAPGPGVGPGFGPGVGAGAYPAPGAGLYSGPPLPVPPGPQHAMAMGAPFGIDPLTGLPYSDKSKVAAGLLQLFLGEFGVGRFYIGDNKTGGIQLALFLVGMATVWVFIGIIPLLFVSIWALVDAIQMLTGSVRDQYGRPLR